MNILLAADYATPASGNFIASCVELGRTLKKSGSSLTFVFPESKNTLCENSWVHWLKREGFPVYLISKDKTDNQIISFLQTVTEKHKIDIIHIHFGMFHHAIISHAKDLGVKVIIHDHMGFAAGINPIKQRLRCAALSAVYRKNKIGIVSVNSQKNSAYFFARHWYVPNGLSFIRNVPQSASREDMRLKLGINPDEKMCMFLGWDLHRKGIDIAVKAINEIRKNNPEMLLGVVGIGNPPDRDCLQFIRESTGIEPNSSWIRYLPSCEDMFAYHRAADVYLSASRSEAFPYGILEAISQNTPVAASDIKSTEWCHRYSKAVVYPTEDPNACADAIKQAVSMGNSPSNAEEIVETYSIEKWCTRMIRIYEQM